MVLNTEHRWWGAPVGIGNDLVWWLDSNLFKPILPKGVIDATDFLIPARSTQLTTIEHFTLKGIIGQNEQKVIGPQENFAFENSGK